MKSKSIRWQLSFTYAGIALLATMLLGAIMLTILQQYYAGQELGYLEDNAVGIEQKIAALHSSEKPPEVLEQMLAAFSFFSNTQVRLLNPEGDVMLDTGPPQLQTALAFDAFPESDKLIGFDSGFTIIASDVISSEEKVGNDISGSFPVEGVLILEGSTSNFPGWVIGETKGDIESLSVSDPMSTRSNQSVQYLYFDQEGEELGIIEISNGPAYGREILRRVAWGWAIAAVGAVMLAAGAGFWVSHRISKPLESLTHTTTLMADGNLSARAEVKREDEFGILASSFNQMATTIEAKVEALRRFVADAAHELGTPLTALRTNLELIDHENASTALDEVARMDSLTRSLLELSRLEALGSEMEFEQVDLALLVENLTESYASRAEQAELDFNLEIEEKPINIEGDADQLRFMIQNLLDNAIKFTPASGHVNVKLTQSDEGAQLRLSDTGIGIPEDDIPNLFARFHRGRNASAYPGSGLGLAIVKTIADQHRATIDVNRKSIGTEFVIQFTSYQQGT